MDYKDAIIRALQTLPKEKLRIVYFVIAGMCAK